MIRFRTEKVLLLHQLLIEQTGGEAGVRDPGLSASALAACETTFDGKELFPSKEEKAARLAVGLVSNHAFVDGNKRIGVYVMLILLEANGIRLQVTDEETYFARTFACQGPDAVPRRPAMDLGAQNITTCFFRLFRTKDPCGSGQRSKERMSLFLRGKIPLGKTSRPLTEDKFRAGSIPEAYPLSESGFHSKDISLSGKCCGAATGICRCAAEERRR